MDSYALLGHRGDTTLAPDGLGGGTMRPGAIVLIGGRPLNQDEPEDLHRFCLTLARPSRRVSIVGAAWNEPGHITELVKHYTLLGANAEDAQLYERADAENVEIAARLACADLIYFAGGTPRQLLEALRETPAWREIFEAWCRGAVLAGISAGSEVMGAVVVSQTAGPAGRRGLGLLPQTVLAGHFSEWQRGSELVATLTVHPECIGIGIDEYTAAVVRPGSNELEIVGRGSASLWISGERQSLVGGGERLFLPDHFWDSPWRHPN